MPMARQQSVLVCLLFGCVAMLAMAQSNTKTPGSLSGEVVEASSGTPENRALVYVRGFVSGLPVDLRQIAFLRRG